MKLSFCVLIVFVGQAALQTNSVLKSEAFKELNCPKDKESIAPFSGPVNFFWLGAPGTWFMPMASERAYRLTAEVLLGRHARSSTELDLIDLRVMSFFSYYRITGFGGSKSFSKMCFPTSQSFPKNILSTVCLSLWGTPGSDIKSAARAVDSVMWTDNENAVLVMPCNEKSNSLDWFVLTKRSTISEATKSSVLSEIRKYGFNTKNAAFYDYKNQRFNSGVSNNKTQSKIQSLDAQRSNSLIRS